MLKSEIGKWVLYNLVVCFTVYWFSNLLLWYPWSVSEKLGQILMLTINPLLWGIASYICIIKYPKFNIVKGVLLNSLLFVVEAIISDLIFFVVIRNAKDKLMHPTTYYGWAFVMCLPIIIYFVFKKTIERNKKHLSDRDFLKPLFIGLISFAIITIILVFNIKFS